MRGTYQEQTRKAATNGRPAGLPSSAFLTLSNIFCFWYVPRMCIVTDRPPLPARHRVGGAGNRAAGHRPIDELQMQTCSCKGRLLTKNEGLLFFRRLQS
jgi:hypothetical protein